MDYFISHDKYLVLTNQYNGMSAKGFKCCSHDDLKVYLCKSDFFIKMYEQLEVSRSFSRDVPCIMYLSETSGRFRSSLGFSEQKGTS